MCVKKHRNLRINGEMLHCLQKLDNTKDRHVHCFHGEYVIATMRCMYEHNMGSRHDNSLNFISQ